MKRFVAIWLSVLLFSTAFAVGGGEDTKPQWADSLRSVHRYTEAVKQRTIFKNQSEAKRLLQEAIEADSAFAPAYFELSAYHLSDNPEEALRYAQRAYRLDSANKWYHRQYGQTLLYLQRYDEALPVFRSLLDREKDPDLYRILAALYEQAGQPFSAIIVLDSAEVNFGRIPLLSRLKRQLLMATQQTDRAILEAEKLVAEEPYEVEHRVLLAELFAITKQDSLAKLHFDRALEIDSTNLSALMALSDYYNARQDYPAMLTVNRRLFAHPEMTKEQKIRQFSLFTTDRNFYRDNYFQINDLASLLAILYPTDPKIVELYANHLIASGELEQALAYYKSHLNDMPPQEDYFLTVIDIESYLERHDSVQLYVKRALELFPERVELHMAEGNVLYRQNRHAAAIRVYKNSLSYATTDSLRSVIWGQIGDVYHSQSEGEERPSRAKKWAQQSYRAYEKALSFNADNVLVLNNWAYFLSLEGRDLERALEMAQRVVELTDNNPTYMDTYAWVLFKMGRLEEARKIQQRAVALDGQKSLELLVHYGDILNAEGKRFMAETYWKRALEKGYDKAQIEQRLATPAPEKTKKPAETPTEKP